MLAETQICGLDAKKYGFIMDRSIDDEARQSKCAEYAFAMGCYKFVETKYAENVNWWLRSPGGSSKAALKIDYDGRSRTGGSSIDSIEAIRPALYLKISSSNLYSYAGTVCSDGTINETPALLEYIKIIHPLETLVIIAASITPQEITIAITRTPQEIIIAIIPTTIKTIPQQIPSHPTKLPHPRNQPNALFCQ